MQKCKFCFIYIPLRGGPDRSLRIYQRKPILAAPTYASLSEGGYHGRHSVDVRRTWEDYAGIILGVLIGLSPWLTGGDEKPLAMGNAVAVGVMVFALAAFELMDLHRSEEVGEIVLALWLRRNLA